MHPHLLTDEQIKKLRSVYRARRRLHVAALKGNQASIDISRRSLARRHEECEALGIPYEFEARVHRAAVSGISFDDINFKSIF